tara:strand:+ start:8362 stop:9363 length:1002 start_codon:yes stop_codon:yes gene_type:complete
MPCKECENNKWKWGENGECKYDSLAECEADNEGYYAEETYNDYPESASNNAKRAIKYKEENGSSCGTQVGWTRARQIANREKLTRRTIARVASFKRHQQHKDVPYDEGCGGIMWDAWGGTSMIEWAIKKLERIDKKSPKNQEEKKKIEISERMEKALEKKMKEHNEDVKDLDVKWNPKVTMAKLRKCFIRGVGAYYTNPDSVRENVTGPDQWALARCNSFLFALKNGKYRSGKHDTDLLPEKHPMRNTKKEQNKKEEKFYSDEQHDYHFNFTKEMMKDLHDDGELIVKVEKDGQEMIIKFTYDVEHGHDEEYIMDLAKTLKQINNKYKKHNGN